MFITQEQRDIIMNKQSSSTGQKGEALHDLPTKLPSMRFSPSFFFLLFK